MGKSSWPWSGKDLSYNNTMILKEKQDKLDFIKIENFSLKVTITKMKIQATNQEKMFAK